MVQFPMTPPMLTKGPGFFPGLRCQPIFRPVAFATSPATDRSSEKSAGRRKRGSGRPPGGGRVGGFAVGRAEGGRDTIEPGLAWPLQDGLATSASAVSVGHRMLGNR